jgi:hypothetical protein
LNRNPKHRLGAERDAAELKEHPFFKSIDWHLLANKQITPPFKPVVESDESVANFDPLFTSSDLRDIPFEWGAGDIGGSGGGGGGGGATSSSGHSYNGPGGGMSASGGSKTTSGAGSMAIKPTRPPLAPAGGSPLTSSIQENFRGFTYTGESMLVSLGGGGGGRPFRIRRDQGRSHTFHAAHVIARSRTQRGIRGWFGRRGDTRRGRRVRVFTRRGQ